MIVSAVTAEESRALADLARGQTVLEMGAHYGYSTVVLASVAELVISVDWHNGDEHAGQCDSYPEFANNISRYGVADRVEVVVERFEDALPRFAAEGRQFDGCFLDGHHSLESVTQDTVLAQPLIRPGGFFSWHDYGRSAATGNPGFQVTEAVDAMFTIAGRVGCLAWAYVPA